MKSLHYAPLALFVFAVCQESCFASDAKEGSITVTAAPAPYTVNNLDNSAKFAEPVLKTPRSVTIIPQQLLQDTHATSLVQALEYVPGIAFKSGDALARPGGDHPTFRGFDGTDALLVDGVRSTASQSRASFAIESVEVIKGSSAIYNGRGNAGGSVNIVSKKPYFAGPVTKLSASLGTDNYRNIAIDSNQPVNETIAARFNAMWQQNDKPKRNAVDYKRWGVAPSVLFNINTNASLLLSYYHFQTRDIPDYSVPFVNGRPLESSRREFYGLVNRDYIEYHVDTPEMIFSYDFADGSSIKNTTQYSQTHQQFIATSPKYNANLFGTGDGGIFMSAKTGDFRTKTFSNLLDYQKQFDLAISTHKFSAGLEYTREQNQRKSIMVRDANGYNIREFPSDKSAISILNGGLTFPYRCQENAFTCTRIGQWNSYNPWTGSVSFQQEPKYPPIKTTNNTISAYLFDSVTFADQFIVSAGLRLDHYDTKIQLADSTHSSMTRSDNLVNWQLGLLYNPIDTISIYTSYSTSASPSNADAIQGGIPDNIYNEFKPEKYQSLEFGVKWSAVNDRLLLSAALFDTSKKNGHISIAPNESAAVGKQQVRGIELSAEGNITDNLSLFAGYSLLESKILHGAYNKSARYSVEQGKRIPLTPQQSASLWTKYHIIPDLSVGAGLAWNGKIYTNADNSNVAPAYTTVNLMAKYQATRALALQINVNNLLDKKYYDTLYSGFATYAAGRQIIATVDYRF